MMNTQNMERPRTQAEFEQMANDWAIKVAEIFGDGTLHVGVVLAALMQVHRATVSLLDEDGRRDESLAVAAYARDLQATCTSIHFPNQKGV